MELTREQALALLKKYNKEPFHIQHALTVEGVMRWFAKENGEDADFWGLCGLLHDVDFENWPQEHCVKAPELLAEVNASPEMVHAICSHGYGICCDVEPTALMEKILFAADEPHRRRREIAAQQVRYGHGAVVSQEEVQGQEVRRRLLPGRDQNRRGAAGLDPGRADGKDHPRHAGLRSLRRRGNGDGWYLTALERERPYLPPGKV